MDRAKLTRPRPTHTVTHVWGDSFRINNKLIKTDAKRGKLFWTIWIYALLCLYQDIEFIKPKKQEADSSHES